MKATLNGIQGLRAFAAYGVVLYHALEGLNTANPEVFPRFVLGQAGVDLFFIISGFVMVYITQGEKETALGFFSKRIARVVPLYWAATLLTIAAALVIPWGYPGINLSPESIASSFFFIPHPNAVGTPVPVLVVGWTLNFEMMFYLLFAIAMLVSTRWRVPLVIAMVAGGVLLARQFDGAAAEFYGLLIALEFAVGCLLAAVINTPAVRSFAQKIPMWPLALVAAAILFFIVPDITNFEPLRVLYYGPPCAVLVFAAVAQDLHRKPIPHTWLNQLGDSSYSAYLLHGFVITALVGVIGQTIGFGLVGGAIVIAGAFIGTIIVSAVSYAWFERPSNRMLRQAFRQKSSRSKQTAAAS